MKAASLAFLLLIVLGAVVVGQTYPPRHSDMESGGDAEDVAAAELAELQSQQAAQHVPCEVEAQRMAQPTVLELIRDAASLNEMIDSLRLWRFDNQRNPWVLVRVNGRLYPMRVEFTELENERSVIVLDLTPEPQQ